MALAQNIGYILIGFIALVSIFLIILTLLEKKLKIKFMQGRFTRNEIYMGKLAKLDISKTEDTLKDLGKIARMFFTEAFHISNSVDDSELENFFSDKNNRKATEFSREITRFLYSGEKINQEQLQNLIKILTEIISSNRIITKEEKEELDKKSQELEKKKKRSKIPLVGEFIKKKTTEKEDNPKAS